MIVNLIKEKRMFSLTLPQKVKGQYWLNDFDQSGAFRQLVSIEADKERWYLKSNKVVSVIGNSNEAVARCELFPNCFLNLKIAGSEEKVVLYTEPIDATRQTLSKIAVKEPSVFTVGRSEDNNFCIDNNFVSGHHARLLYDGENWSVSDSGSRNGTYVNGYRVQDQRLKPGDFIYIMGLKIVIGGNYLAVNNPDEKMKVRSSGLALYTSQRVTREGGADDPVEKKYFFRSPRFHREVEQTEIKIDAPPPLQKQDTVPLALMLGPSLTMAMTSVSTGILSVSSALSNGGDFTQVLPTLVMSVSMLLGTVLWPILTKRHEKKEKIKNEKKRQEKYLAYLNDIGDIIKSTGKVQSEILFENHVPQEECVERIIRQKTNLWERVIGQKDFLKLRLGIGNVPMNIDVKYQEKRFSMEDDSLGNAMLALAEEPKILENVPISISFTENTAIGIYGEKSACDNMVSALLLQMIALHSYDELKIVFITDKEDEEKWSFVKYIPHFWNDGKSVRFFAKTIEEVKELSAVFEKEIALRRENARNGEYSPYYVFVATSNTLRKKCTAIQQILRSKSNLGFTVLFTGDGLKDFPKETKTVINANGKNSAIFDRDDTSGKQTRFIADIANGAVFENVSAQIANIELDLENQNYVLPNMLTFLEMFSVGKVEHLNSLTRWKENNPTKTLQTPIGVGTDGDLFMLDLHEKYHGPHGLVAGMTGSGKSEFIITYVLSLAVNYHPDEVAFILIDYKGGGLAGAFEDQDKGIKLPHLAGTITNLDGAAITRSLVSIQSELRRRQAIFNEARKISNEGTIDIYKYQQLYRDKVVSEPLPHLFIISDEFAELKTQQPEFMAQLISAARIGRSLGVHLILATQKPSGVVDDQIWSNSKFRVCLKVQEKSDSQDMIKCPDAAELSQTGRFYLQVGFNELFALGQSAWCGAEYVPSDTVEKPVDSSIQIIDNLGRVIMNAKPEKRAVSGTSHKQIVTIVKYLSDLALDEGVSVKKLWLDPIPARIYLEQLEDKYGAKDSGFELAPVIGEYDDPFNQKQEVLRLPFAKEGNCLIYGATGSGKTTFLTTLCYSLIKNHSVDEVNLYIMDYGSETLRMFERAPHTGGVITATDDDKTRNLIKLLKQELETRRALFSRFGGDHLSYCRNSGSSVPNIVVVLNNFSAFAEQYEDLQDDFALLTRDGVKYGVFFVVTSSSTAAVRYRVQQNFKTMLTMQLNDATDYAAVVGKTDGLIPSKFKGRGLIALDKVYEFQTACCSDAEDVQEYMREFCDGLAKESQSFAKPVPMLPETVDKAFVQKYIHGLRSVPVGVAKESLEVVSANLEKNVVLPVLSIDVADLTRTLFGLYSVVKSVCITKLIDAEKLLDGVDIAGKSEDFDETVLEIFEAMVERNNNYKDSGMDETVLEQYEEKTYFIIGFKRFYEQLSRDSQDKMKALLERAVPRYKIRFVIFDSVSQINTFSYEQWFKNLISGTDGVWVGDGVADQYVFKINKITSELYDELEPDYGYAVIRNKPIRIKLLMGSTEGELL